MKEKGRKDGKREKIKGGEMETCIEGQGDKGYKDKGRREVKEQREENVKRHGENGIYN